MAELKMNFEKMAEGFIKTATAKGLFVGWWIPVSERLPETDGRYLCTYEDDIEENCVDFGSYENGEWYVDKVIAWLPLPKPYKEG